MKNLNKKLFFLINNLLIICSNAQVPFQASGDCQRTKNINCLDAQVSYLNKDNIRATFKYECFSKIENGTPIILIVQLQF